MTTDPASADDAYDGYRRSSRHLTMRDGVRLAIDIIRPTLDGDLHTEPLPVLWSHTPYTRAGIDENGDIDASPVEGWGRMLPLVAAGYVVAQVDVRGGGTSFGRSNGPFQTAEADDAHEVTEWLAAQGWCTGAVGMWGRSYLAITQLLCASRRPPSLKAIFPEMAWWDAYDVMRPGGGMRDDLTAMWSTLVRGLDMGIPALSEDIDGEVVVVNPAAPVDDDVDGALARAARRDHYANRDVWDFVSSNPLRDSIDIDGVAAWPPRSPSRLHEEIAASGVAIYNYIGWYDGFTRDACLSFVGLPNPSRLLIDPHYHSEYPGTPGADPTNCLLAEQRRWFDHWLKGIDNGVTEEPPVRYFLLGSDGDPWRTAPTWPPPETRPISWHLVAGGGLGLGAPSAGEPGADEYTVDPGTGTGPANRWANLYGGPGRVTPFEDAPHLGYPDMASNDARALTYTSEPLDADLTLVGHPVIRLWIETDTDLDVFAFLEAVSPDGFSRYLSEGCLRVSHRAEAEAPYPGLDLPWHPSGAADLLEVIDEPMAMAFDLQPIGTVVRAGDRIRIAITGAEQGSHEMLIDPADPPTIRVLCGGGHPSSISLPVFESQS